MPQNQAKIVRVQIEHVDEYQPDLSYLTDPDRYAGLPDDEVSRYIREDEARLSSYGITWTSIGIRAVATLAVPFASGGVHILQSVVSPGCWGICSDADQCEFDAVAGEELDSLRRLLVALGFDAHEARRAVAAHDIGPIERRNTTLGDQYRCIDIAPSVN